MGQRTIASAKEAGSTLRRLLLVLVVAAVMAAMATGPANAATIHNDGSDSHSGVILVSNNSSFDTFRFDNDALDLDDILDFGDLVDVDVDGGDVDVDVNL